jgi:hypothetical protein
MAGRSVLGLRTPLCCIALHPTPRNHVELPAGLQREGGGVAPRRMGEKRSACRKYIMEVITNAKSGLATPHPPNPAPTTPAHGPRPAGGGCTPCALVLWPGPHTRILVRGHHAAHPAQAWLAGGLRPALAARGGGCACVGPPSSSNSRVSVHARPAGCGKPVLAAVAAMPVRCPPCSCSMRGRRVGPGRPGSHARVWGRLTSPHIRPSGHSPTPPPLLCSLAPPAPRRPTRTSGPATPRSYPLAPHVRGVCVCVCVRAQPERAPWPR